MLNKSSKNVKVISLKKSVKEVRMLNRNSVIVRKYMKTRPFDLQLYKASAGGGKKTLK